MFIIILGISKQSTLVDGRSDCLRLQFNLTKNRKNEQSSGRLLIESMLRALLIVLDSLMTAEVLRMHDLA